MGGNEATRAGIAPAAGGEWIERVGNLSYEDFVERYRTPRRPVVIADALERWPALGKFTPQYFQREHGDRPVRINGRDYRLGDIIALQLASTADAPGPYPCTVFDCADLIADVSPRFDYSLPNRHTHPLVPKSLFEWVHHVEIFFGGPGGQFPSLHYDFLRMHAWITQVYGHKEFTLYERGQEHLLYVRPSTPWLSEVDTPSTPDYDRFPLLRDARRQTIVLGPGDALFMPCGTWHSARCLDVGITVAFDQLGPDNWSDFIGDVTAERRRAGKPIRAALTGAYLRALGLVLDGAERFGANRRADWALH